MQDPPGEMIDAASRVFARGGLQAFSLAAVAVELGAPREEVERAFSNEGALLRALVLRSVRLVTERVIAAVQGAADGPEAMTLFFRTWAEFYDERIHDFRCVFLVRQSAPPEVFGMAPGEADRLFPPIINATLDALETKLLGDRGPTALPAGIHARRLAFGALLSVMGFLTARATAQADGSKILHGRDAMIVEMSASLSAPFAAIRQLTALNEVATALARLRHEAELVARVPVFLGAVLALRNPAFALSRDGGWAVDVPAEARRAQPEDRTVLVEIGAGGMMIATPVRYEGRPEGVMWGTCDSSTRRFDERDVARIETLASMVGLALENVRLYEGLQTQLDARTRTLTEAHVRLAEAEKMAALGKTVAAVVHELNTPVASVMSAGSTLSRAVEKLRGATAPADAARIVGIIEQSGGLMRTGAERVSTVVEQLKRFSRLDAADVERIDLGHAVRDVVALLRPELGAECLVELELGELPAVTCFATRIHHALTNVIRLAVQSIGARGTIRIGTRRTGEHEVTVRIEDDGQGMTQDELARLLEPGFSAKGGRVRGDLAFATATQIVRDHGGELRIESAPGQGTRVTMILPVETPRSA